MKKLISIVVTCWLLFAIVSFITFLVSFDKIEDNNSIIQVNRFQNYIEVELDFDRITNVQLENKRMNSDFSNIESVKVINLLNDVDLELLEVIPDINSQIIFRKIDDSNILIRYEVKTRSYIIEEFKVRYLSVILVSLLTIVALIYIMYIYLLRPIKRLPKLSGELAKGHLRQRIDQERFGYYREFLWGLDLLREVLVEEKNKNIGLEKNRKTLVASLSHDIKTPLASIKNYSTAIRDGIYEKEDEVREALDIIIEKSAVIENLTNELLNSSKNAMNSINVNPQSFYLDDIVQQSDYMIKQGIDKLEIEYTLHYNVSNLQVLIDQDCFLEVIVNLTENAKKYGDGKFIDLRVERRDNFILFSFENSGTPVNDNELKYIFTSFYRGSNSGDEKGHGLGLFIAKQIIRSLNGEIYAENTVNGFKIVIAIRII